MFATRIHLFRIAGIPLRLDLSWFLIAVFLAWSLATNYFPWAAPGLETATYWSMGVIGALFLFASIVAHELAHALVARRFDMPISGITLFLFGGVAELEDEPPTPRSEFWVAIAGPIASFLIAGVLFAILQTGIVTGPGQQPLAAVVAYLAVINLVVAVFNLIPAFPLDGGRILRSALWAWRDDLPWATRVAAASGTVLAMVLITLGVLNALLGAFVAGMWQMLLGFFIYAAAGASRTASEVRHGLGGVRVGRLMTADVVTVDAGLSVQDLVEDYFFRHHLRSFPVISGGRLVGCVRLADVNELPRTNWPKTAVGDIMRACDEKTVVPPEMTAIEALKRMSESGDGRLLVASGDRLEGILAADDIMGYLAVRNELEAPATGRRPRTDTTEAAAGGRGGRW